MPTIADKWNNIYQNKPFNPTPSQVLADYRYLLPQQGIALDLACGQGGNAILLAKLGFTVQAWDISAVAIGQLADYARLHNIKITTQLRDVTIAPPAVNSLDVLVVSFFLARSLSAPLYAALKPGGLLFYQSYCQQKISEQGPTNPDYLLADNELLHLFAKMKVRIYQQDALLGDSKQGLRNQALLVAEKVN